MNYLIYFEGDIILYYDIYKEEKKRCNVESYFVNYSY